MRSHTFSGHTNTNSSKRYIAMLMYYLEMQLNAKTLKLLQQTVRPGLLLSFQFTTVDQYLGFVGVIVVILLLLKIVVSCICVGAILLYQSINQWHLVVSSSCSLQIWVRLVKRWVPLVKLLIN